jgi:hypothetical protein
MGFYGIDVENLSVVISNLFLLSKIGNEHEQVPYSTYLFMFMLLTLYHYQDFGGIFFHELDFINLLQF